MIEESSLTFVIHGAIVGNTGYELKKDRHTENLIRSIRKYYPDSKLILSTWHNQNFTNLTKLVDVICLESDPGPNYNSIAYGNNTFNNINRHILSSYNGIKAVKTNFSCVLRSDLLFKNNRMIDHYNKNYKYIEKPDLFELPIAVNSYGTINPTAFIKFQPYLFHICDFLYLGKTSDLLKYFSIPLDIDSRPDEMGNVVYCYFRDIAPKPITHWSFNHKYNSRYVPETYNFVEFYLKETGERILESSYECSIEKIHRHNSIIFNNFILLDSNQFGFIWQKLTNHEFKYHFLSSFSRYRYSDWLVKVNDGPITRLINKLDWFFYVVIYILFRIWRIFSIIFLILNRKLLFKIYKLIFN